MAESKSLIDANSVSSVSRSPKPAQLVTLPSQMNCHEHGYTQIVIGLKGQAEFDIAGYGNRIGPGKGCIVTSHSDHAFGGFVDASDILVLNLPEPASDDPEVLKRLNELSNRESYFSLDGQIQRLIAMLVQEMQLSPDDELLSRACHDTLMALLNRHIKAMNYQCRNARIDLTLIDQYIECHLNRRISIAQLAGSVFLGESQFHLLFKDHMGMTPHQYVLNKRIEAAKKFIEETDYSLGQIAKLTGFSGQSTFTHTFSRLEGVSPSQYKKRDIRHRH